MFNEGILDSTKCSFLQIVAIDQVSKVYFSYISLFGL